MTGPYFRLVSIAVVAGSLLPLLVSLASGTTLAPSPGLRPELALLALALVAGAVALRVLARAPRPGVDADAREQAEFLDRLPARWGAAAIVASAASSLFLELTVIRWQSTVFEFFAFYKNLGLLFCFAGLGLGYALAARDRIIPLVWSIVLLAAQVVLLLGLRYGLGSWRAQSLIATPFTEQRHMGFGPAEGVQWVVIYAFLSVVFLLTALAFLPVGQVCGRLLRHRPPLRAYGHNLLGSLIGVLLAFAASWLWTPPVVWFAVAFSGLLPFLVYRPRTLLAGGLFALLALAALAWPTSFGWERIYSPYQLLERGPGEGGLMMIRAAGQYYQRVLDLSPSRQGIDPDLKRTAAHYDWPYRLHGRARRVAVVGAGAGNDVAAALRAGAEAVDAVEIDPAILALGRDYHPEGPYQDPRVRPIVDDARSFFRRTSETYDLIVYGLLDSHTLLSQASSVRLDSFVYTVEGLREARARLKEDGVLSLSFSILSRSLGRKIVLMMQEAFDGQAPVVFRSGYDGSVVFAQSRRGGLVAPPALVAETRFEPVRFGGPGLRADVSTDDWPFFYMPQRVYPRSYLVMVALVLALSGALTANFIRERPRVGHAAFFLLGAGFMLVETKAITELGLVFGNTWHVIGIAIAGVLLMAYLANAFVERAGVARTLLPFLLLFASLVGGVVLASAGGLPSTLAGRIGTVVVLTGPMFFSGIVFSTLIRSSSDVSAALAMNLLGTMCGGLLEYNSMYFGFRFLYWLALACYGAAFLTTLRRQR
jgi:hypothetical protein